MISFNKPYLTGKETFYIEEAVKSFQLSGNGIFTKKCQRFFQETYNFHKCLLTTSCTDALEMAAMLADIKAGDEVIVPGYTFVSSALAFVRQGAKIVFADSREDHPNIDADKIEALITPKTKAIVPVHYAGVACEMDKIMDLAQRYNLLVIEDAAQAIDSFYTPTPDKKALGSIGHFGCFSFHETKNIISGEGGMLVINDERFVKRAEIIWEKGTNRAEFFRGKVNKYGWVDTGSSFLPSEIVAAFLYAQCENLEGIQQKRKKLWNAYYESLAPLEAAGKLKLPRIPGDSTNNAHIFYILCNDLEERSRLIKYLAAHQIEAVFHYLSLHSSPYYKDKHDGRALSNCDHYADSLVRLPMYYELTLHEVSRISHCISEFYKN